MPLWFSFPFELLSSLFVRCQIPSFAFAVCELQVHETSSSTLQATREGEAIHVDGRKASQKY